MSLKYRALFGGRKTVMPEDVHRRLFFSFLNIFTERKNVAYSSDGITDFLYKVIKANLLE